MLFIFEAVFFTAVVSQTVDEVRWLPCRFLDKQVVLVEKFVYPEEDFGLHEQYVPYEKKWEKIYVNETTYEFRDAALQFGQPGDSPVHPELITFLVTTSEVDMRRYVTGGLDTLKCGISRHHMEGTVRWPISGAQEQDSWFSCTLYRTGGLFSITTFLRHSPSELNVMQPDLHWIQIADGETISTTAAMIVSSNTESVQVGLRKEQTLNCEFTIDHKSAHLTVEWHLQLKGRRSKLYDGPRSKLFSYSSQTGESEGSGVSVEAIGRGDASLKIPLTTLTSEGKYICSVLVPPLSCSRDNVLQIMEPPRVSLNVNSEVSLTEGELQRMNCEAEGFYPLDVHMEWLKESLAPGVSSVPELLNIVMYSMRRHNSDGSYSLTAFFMLDPKLQDSGYRYTCRVSHDSLQMPIRKSFTLRVTEKKSYIWYMPPILAIFGVLLFVLLRFKQRSGLVLEPNG